MNAIVFIGHPGSCDDVFWLFTSNKNIVRSVAILGMALLLQ